MGTFPWVTIPHRSFILEPRPVADRRPGGGQGVCATPQKSPNPSTSSTCGEQSHVGALMEYMITTALLVGVVLAGFGTAIFTGYEIARFVASAM